jgi:hypothetical protein
MDTSFTKLQLFFHKVSVIVNPFPPTFLSDVVGSLLKSQSSSCKLCFSAPSSAKGRPRIASFQAPKTCKLEDAKSGLEAG